MVSNKARHTSIRHCLTSLLEQLTTKILKPNSNKHKRVELWAKSINFVNLGCHFPCASSAKNPRSMYARVPKAMAQFVLKIENLSHIMGPTPILEMARLRSPSSSGLFGSKRTFIESEASPLSNHLSRGKY